MGVLHIYLSKLQKTFYRFYKSEDGSTLINFQTHLVQIFEITIENNMSLAIKTITLVHNFQDYRTKLFISYRNYCK